MSKRTEELQETQETTAAPNQRLPLVAIVGRPNVGKSTLFNRLVGHREAIVHDAPGVTRDRHYSRAWTLGRDYAIVDTGGFDPESDDPMRQGIARQVQIAIEQADTVVCVLDAAVGPTDADRQAVQLLRKSGRPVVYVANKADSDNLELTSSELYRLGIEELLPMSALHGRGFHRLEDALIEKLPALADLEDAVDSDKKTIRVAIVGRPNAGKSSLVNFLAGEERMLVDDRPGTTRDPVDVEVEKRGHRFKFVDTAGIRRKSKVEKEGDAIEVVSVLRAMRAIEACEIVVLLCDASIGVAEQDAKILGLAVDRGRSVILALNKMDLVPSADARKMESDARDKTTFAPWAPVVLTSASTGKGVNTLLDQIIKTHENFHNRVGTGELNRFFETVLETHPPPTQGGKCPRFYFITQAESAPPLFVVMTNAPDSIHFSYQRYVANQIRKHFGFDGVPVRVVYRERRRRHSKHQKSDE